MTVAVFGAAGYGGQVLMRLLLDHPETEAVLPVSSSAAGRTIDERDGGIGPDPEGKLPPKRVLLTREQALAAKPDAVFSALPHGASADFCAPFFRNAVIFDLSADFRIDDPAVHEAAYGSPPPMGDFRDSAVYGLAERYRRDIAQADLIAVPGCYPTCTLLPLLPLAEAGLVTGPVTVNALSGISGAGRSAKEESLFVERSENAVAYNPGTAHRHVPEMVQEVRKAGSDSPLYFTPHLVPMRRGMAATITLPLDGSAEGTEGRVEQILSEAYADSLFVNLTGHKIPATRDVVGSNRCDIGWRVTKSSDGQGGMLSLFSVIDNLVKGASGQAVQDFNIRFGYPENAGLPIRGEV